MPYNAAQEYIAVQALHYAKVGTHRTPLRLRASAAYQKSPADGRAARVYPNVEARPVHVVNGGASIGAVNAWNPARITNPCRIAATRAGSRCGVVGRLSR